jgi:type VI secretion system lysozyme-like protein
MARVPPLFGEEPLQPSVLDRLLDDEPTVQREPPSREAATRRSLTVLPEALAELPTSLINYGLPDLQSLEIREDHALVRLGAVIEESIRTFEPRLQGVRVMPRATDLETRLVDRRVRFDIEAVLVVEPLRESVRFSSTLDVSRGAFDVTGEA